MLKSGLLGAVGIVAVVGGVLVAQTPAGPAFEAASVKLNTSGDADSTNMVQAGGRYLATNLTVRTLVRTAYGVQEQQIVGPMSLNTDRFDIVAKAAGPPATTVAFREQVRPLLQTLLADRFKLTLHHELRAFRIYSLVVARRDGQLGPRLHPAANCTPGTVPPSDVPRQRPGILGDPSGPLPCGGELARAGRMTATATPFSLFVTRLSSWTDRIVVDRTGLAGKYDWDLDWTLEQSLSAGPSTSADRSSDSGVPLFTAIEEQLGLKLESTTGPVDVLVIDHVEHPTED